LAGDHRPWIKHIKLDPVEVEQHGDTAIEVSYYTMRSADDQVIDHGKGIVIWKHEDDIWMLHRDIWTSSIAQQLCRKFECYVSYYSRGKAHNKSVQPTNHVPVFPAALLREAVGRDRNRRGSHDWRLTLTVRVRQNEPSWPHDSRLAASGHFSGRCGSKGLLLREYRTLPPN
jgi:hypothetical protein